MEPKIILLSLLLSLSFLAYSQADSDFPIDDTEASLSKEIINNDNWTFYSDESHHRLYIDLELLGGYATDLTIRDEEGEIVLSEELMEVPKNSIYELDLSRLEKGEYSLKIRTYNDIVQRNVEVK